MTAESDIAAIADGASNPASRVRTALTAVLARGDSTSWESPVSTPPSTGWSWVNQGTSTISAEASGAQVLRKPSTGAANLTLRVRSHSSGDVVTSRIDRHVVATSAQAGMVVRESSTGKLTLFAAQPNNTGTNAFNVENWNSATSFSGVVQASGLAAAWIVQRPHWLRINDNGTNLIFSYSLSGFDDAWIEFHSMSRTAFLAGGPDEIGWYVRDNSSLVIAVLGSWGVE